MTPWPVIAAHSALSDVEHLANKTAAGAGAIAAVVAAAKPGAKIVELCIKGDAAINE